MSINDDKLEAAVAALEKEPLFHMSLGSKELFHSNFLAWLANTFPDQVADVFRPWVAPVDGARPRSSELGATSEREKRHVDLILHLPDLASIAIENKVFSVPDEDQLARLSTELALLAQDQPRARVYSRVLLSLMSPGWLADQGTPEHKGWRWMSYRELANGLHAQVPLILAADAFAGGLVQHYVELVTLLVKLMDLLGTPAPGEPFLLDQGTVNRLERSRISAGVQKSRASRIAHELQRKVQDNGWSDVDVAYDFTNGTSLLEGFVQRGTKGRRTGDAIGWQIQGEQFRLAVIAAKHPGREKRAEREAYVEQHYTHWFDFAGLAKVVGAAAAVPALPPNGWRFQGYNPSFVYRYCPAPKLTPSQIVDLGLLYLNRARELL
jgi:hypothetical protein